VWQLFVAREEQQKSIQNFILPLRWLTLANQLVPVNLSLLFSLVRLFFPESFSRLLFTNLDHAIHISDLDR
jgi:hypothetical protein